MAFAIDASGNGRVMERNKLNIMFMAMFTSLLMNVSPVLSAQDAGQGPQLFISEPAFDFKEIKEEDVAEHAFTVLNKGDQPLEIKDVKPT